jgi:AmmeMemoRadiSam system protein B/AmmeMemoRadiSam system protein A
MVLSLLLVYLSALSACQAQQPQKRRPASAAGTFYPADPKELAAMVDDLLAKAVVPNLQNVAALVAPHAGYQYSAAVAAHSYALLKGRKIERVVLISPSHLESFSFAAVYDGSAYSTPFGDVPVDLDFAAKLVKSSKQIQLSGRGHGAVAGRSEHALEVQLPFLQRALGQFKLVPIVMGDQSYALCRSLGIALAKNIQGTSTVIIASSDLSHYHSYTEASGLDTRTLRAVAEFDYLSLSQNLDTRIWEACGGGPIVAAMIAAERLGARKAQILKYANSGDVTGDHSQVVGYGAVAIYKGTGDAAAGGASLGEADRKELFLIAHNAVETAVRDRKLYQYSTSKLEALNQDRGAFVTLKINGELRGCIGYVSPMKPLALTVRDVAVSAALKDNRFAPVSVAELPSLQYEISVLSPMHRVLDVLKEIKIGRDGLVMVQGANMGLLLPQVPGEQGWDLTTFLEQTCAKAGLPERCWKDDRTDIFSFTAQVLEEHEPVPPKPPQGTPHP